MACQRGQATIEWVGLVLLAALALGAVVAVVPVIDGRSFGGFLTHRVFCAVRGTCAEGGDRELARTYGERDAALLREYAPNLVYESGERQIPVDYRRCRTVSCAVAPDDRDLDVHTTDSGLPATGFTRIVRRGGRTYLQYWLYYPDSNSTVGEIDKLWKAAPFGDWPGWHADDWEGYQVRIDPGGSRRVRSSSHGHYQWCKEAECRNVWGRHTGWTRVSRGSHAGHQALKREVSGQPPPSGRIPVARARLRVRYRRQLPGVDLRERTTTGEGIRLVPLESIEPGSYRPLDGAIKAPWHKEVYNDPESDES